MVKLTKENKLKDCDTDFLVQKILGKNAVYSSYTTLANLLINHIKDYLLLSKIHEKNIYTETLWGEILIERRLKRNLLLKLTNFKFDLYKDNYSLMKLFYHKREDFFYEHLNLSKKNYKTMLDKLSKHISSFKDYYNHYQLELQIGYISLSRQINMSPNNNENELLSLIAPNSFPALDVIFGILFLIIIDYCSFEVNNCMLINQQHIAGGNKHSY